MAIKCVLKNSLSKSSVDNIITEITILKKIKQKFIVELKDFQWDEFYIYLIFEYCSGGELSKYIKLNKRLPESTVQHFLQQIASALKVLRSHNVAHMDLKPQNILISHPPVRSWRNVDLKIADFGLAQYLRSNDSASSMRGSPLYMAPEILLGSSYDARVDLWSIGIILYECLFGKAPYSSGTFHELAEKIKCDKKIIIPNGIHLSQNCRDLLSRLLERNPDKRISFEDFFSHPFVDLQHMPSPESYKKGVDLIRQAVEMDATGKNHKEVLDLYYYGLQYLVPIYNWGDGVNVYNERKQKEFKEKIIEYIERAEILKKKCNINSLTDEEAGQIHESFKFAEKADEYFEKNDLQNAFENYNVAFDLILPVFSKMNEKTKSEFHLVIDEWMTKAEQIKKQLKICDRENRKQKMERTIQIHRNSSDNIMSHKKINAISYDDFILNTFNSNDSLFKPTCYVQ